MVEDRQDTFQLEDLFSCRVVVDACSPVDQHVVRFEPARADMLVI